MMVITMQCVSKLLHSWIITDHVKDESMSDIFEKSPEEHATNKGRCNAPRRIVEVCVAVIQHIDNNRHIHSPDHQRVSLG